MLLKGRKLNTSLSFFSRKPDRDYNRTLSSKFIFYTEVIIMEQHEIELGIRVGIRHIRDIQETALNDLAKDLRVKGRVLTYEDTQILKELQTAGNILEKRVVAFYEHFVDADKEVVPIIDEEDEFI